MKIPVRPTVMADNTRSSTTTKKLRNIKFPYKVKYLTNNVLSFPNYVNTHPPAAQMTFRTLLKLI